MEARNAIFDRARILRFFVFAVVASFHGPLAAETTTPTPSEEAVATIQTVTDTIKKDSSELYRSLNSEARRTLERLKNYPSLNSYSALDPRSWIFATRESEQARLIDQMDFAQNQLGDSRLVRLKILFDNYQHQITSLRQQIVDLKLQLQTAVPIKELSWLTSLLLPILPEFIAPPVTENITGQIAKDEVRIQQLKNDAAYVTAQIGEDLRNLGVQINSNQLELVMTTVTGKQDLQLVSAFDNVRRLVGMIQKQLKPDTAIELAREYYGMYTLMLAALVQMQNSQIDRISTVYISRLNALAAKVALNSSQADDLLKHSRNPNMLKINKKANEQMLVLVNRYREFLIAKVKKIQSSAAEQRKVYLEALNTYSTYDVAIGLLDAIETHRKELRSFDSAILELPNLIDLGDFSLNQQISRISVEIERGS